MKSMTEPELLIKISQGNESAFRVLFERHSPTVLGYLIKLLKNKAKAEEILQEIWMKLLKNSASLKVTDSVLPWLLTLARNAALDDLRSSKKLDLFDDIEKIDTPELIQKSEIEQLISTQEQADILKNCLEHLADSQRVATLLWMSEDISLDQIAREMGDRFTLASVKSLLFRAKKHLGDCLKRADS